MTRECTDLYWQQIAAVPNAAVILEKIESTWKPCMKMLLDSGTDVYIAVKAVVNKVRRKIDFIGTSYNGRFNGLVFVDGSDLSALDYAKSQGYKVGVEMTSISDLSAAEKSDVVVIFKGDSSDYTENCGYYGQGPLCKRTESQKIDSLRFAIARGDQPSSKFVSLIFDASIEKMAEISNIHYGNEFNGGIFLSDSLVLDPTFKPTYFDGMVELINQNMVDSSPNCGCSEIDECAQETDHCPENSHCVNTDGSFDCNCNDGFEPLANQDLV